MTHKLAALAFVIYIKIDFLSAAFVTLVVALRLLLLLLK
jgi:hypothetical protein